MNYLARALAAFLVVGAARAQDAPRDQPASEPTKTVKVTAEGYTRDDAIRQALKKALEQGAGAEISSHTTVQNFVLIRDTIYSRASGVVADYKVLDERPSGDGAVTVTIEAVVRPSAVAKAWGDVQNVLDQIGRPKIMVWIDETIDGDLQSDSVVESRIEQMFVKAGFDVVERKATADLRNREQADARNDRDGAKVARVAKEAGAHILIRGSSNANRAGLERLYEVPAAFYNCDVQAKVYYADTGRVLASESLPTTRGGVRSRNEFSPQAARAALVAATFPEQERPGHEPPLAVRLFDSVMQQWATLLSAGGDIDLEVTGVDFKTYLDLKRALTGIERIRSADADFTKNTATFRIKSDLSAETLAELLTAKPFDGWLEVTDLKPTRIQAKRAGR